MFQSDERGINIMCMPVEIIEKILGELSTPDRVNFTKTCRRFYNLQRSAKLWVDMFQQHLPQSTYLREMGYWESESASVWRQRYIDARDIVYQFFQSVRFQCTAMTRAFSQDFKLLTINAPFSIDNINSINTDLQMQMRDVVAIFMSSFMIPGVRYMPHANIESIHTLVGHYMQTTPAFKQDLMRMVEVAAMNRDCPALHRALNDGRLWQAYLKTINHFNILMQCHHSFYDEDEEGNIALCEYIAECIPTRRQLNEHTEHFRNWYIK